MCSGIAYGFIPKYSCAIGADGKSLPSCNNVPAGEVCCTKASNIGWRYTLYTLGAVTLVAFVMRFVVFRFQESPKFLLYRGQDEKAVEVLHEIAKFNGRESTITLETFNALTEEEASLQSRESGGTPMLGAGAKQVQISFGQKVMLEFSRYKLLFANAAIARMTILVWITYIFDYWGFSVAGRCIP